MYSRVILISILAAMASSSVSASFIPIGSSGLAAIKETRDIPVDVTHTLNDKRANDDKGKDKGKDATKQKDASAAEADGGDGGVFGKCEPKMIFQGGLGNRPETEFTFQSSDPTCSDGQGEALNPNIITKHIKDVVDNKCGASEKGKALVAAAVTKVEGLKVRDQSVADTWNKALGLA
ncbi:BgTH12-05943 [Blumeria graminis f. sp. triticale]|uniref:BgTH12-05943 n=1 Tax=Blumeria graminis f. sp. triticale TaxID=1689686 RepID=A0A9W4DLX9_BLUGR|nr:BgTH12-05943 [Blumeria graminis f. sp. triticale]